MDLLSGPHNNNKLFLLFFKPNKEPPPIECVHVWCVHSIGHVEYEAATRLISPSMLDWISASRTHLVCAGLDILS